MTDQPIADVLHKLRKVKPNGKDSWTACCPAHEDQNPSLSVSVGSDNRVLFNCFAGCSPDAVRSALGLSWKDLHAVRDHGLQPRKLQSEAPHEQVQEDAKAPDESPRGRPYASLEEVRSMYLQQLGEPTESWTYRDPIRGDDFGEVLRWETPNGKTIRPAFRFKDGWRPTYPVNRPLYGLESIQAEPRVFVTEGEKAAARIHALGFPAVTSPGGSKAAGAADWSRLTAPEVIVLPDADDAGQAYAEDVTECLQGSDRVVIVLPLPGLRPRSGDDVVEWIENIHDGDEEAAALALEVLAGEAVWSARRRHQVLSVAEVLDDPAWSRPPEVLRSGVSWWDDIQPFGGIERGSLTILAAPPRCFKTSLMLYLAWKLAAAGRRVHYLAGEMTRPALVRRIVAMAGEVAPYLVSDPQDPDLSRRVNGAVQEIRDLADHLFLGRAPITLDGISRASENADVVLVDYLQLVQPDKDYAGTGRVDELDASMRSVLSVTQQGATVIAAAALNRIGRDTVSLGSIRGSSAIEYGATTVYATTETLAGIDPEADTQPSERITAEYRCLKQREGEAVPLRFDLALQLGPLPVEPTQ